MTSSPRPLAPNPRPRRPQAGYAMLLVFLMAAMIAIALYNELPRVAFEAQRAKEQMLIERGEQYKRAIQLFVRKVNRYPATIEELESLNNTRFLRKRYIDPMTGKDKWRLIHVNGGVLTDSIIPPKNAQGQGQQQQANTNTFIGEGPVMGATNDPSQQQINPAMRRRSSDDRPVVTQEVAATPPPDPDADSSSDNSDNNDNSDETPAPGTPGAAANVPPAPNQVPPGLFPGRVPQPGMFQPGANPGQPGSGQPGFGQSGFINPATAGQQMSGLGSAGGMSGNTGQNPSSQDSSGGIYVAPGLGQSSSTSSGANTGSPIGQPGQPGMPGMPGQPPGFPGRPGMFPSQLPGQQQSGFQSAGGFGQSATPSGFGNSVNGGNSFGSQNGPSNNFGLGGPSTGQPGGLSGMGGTQVGGGIAGVASESTGPAIKVYNERKKYNEWEFVYDQSKDRGLAGVQRGGGAPGTPAGQMGSMPPGMNPQQPGGPNGPGNNTVPSGLFNSQSSFGSSTPQQPQPQPQQPQN